MQFSEFIKTISKIEHLELPGEEIHLKMVPIKRILELKKQRQQSKNPKQSGVLVLFYPNDQEEIHLVLILRTAYNGIHSSQVGFPGGKFEKEDKSLKQTALREAHEEVGVLPKSVKVLKKLSQVYIAPSNFMVQPYFGITKTTPKFAPDKNEVETIIEVSLSHFMDDSVLVTKTLSTSYVSEIEVPAFLLNGHVVWGATAMILNEVRFLLKSLF